MSNNFLCKDRWSPYVVGALIGVLSWLTFYVSHQHIGTTLAFVKFTALIENFFTEGRVSESIYFQKYIPGKPFFTWQPVFVVFIFVGSFVASRLSGKIKLEYVPKLWEKNFGPSQTVRKVGAFIGGFILLFGARLAGGCTSGHAVSGGLQLAVSGWLFIAALFTTGIITSFLIYRKRR